jgi:hypothetical protein
MYMSYRVGIEDNLGHVRQYLIQRGYQVGTLDKDVEGYDVLVVTGQNTNFMGIQDTDTRIPVIDASGLTSEEVYRRIETSLGIKE